MQKRQQRGVTTKQEITGRVNPKFQSHPSLESANTISNSSLQDLDETEFTGSELARYMGELNFDLVTWWILITKLVIRATYRLSMKGWTLKKLNLTRDIS